MDWYKKLVPGTIVLFGVFVDRPRWILEISKGAVFYLMFPDVPGTRNFQIFLGRGTGEGDRREVWLRWGGRGSRKEGMTL